MKKVLNKRSNETSGSYAKSPTTNNLEYGEIAVNYHDGVEKLFIKNDYNQIISFPTDEQVTASLNEKQDVINDLSSIRSGAVLGATAYQKPQDGIPARDIAPGVIPDVSQFITKDVNDLTNYPTTTTVNQSIEEAIDSIPFSEGSGTDSAEQWNCTASGNYSVSEGYNTTAKGQASHAEGYTNTVESQYAHIEGAINYVGNDTTKVPASADTSLYNTVSSGSHAEGQGNVIINAPYSHVEGCRNKIFKNESTVVKGAHVEGKQNVASGNYSHVEGLLNKVFEEEGHAEGFQVEVQAMQGHAEGWYTSVGGRAGHAEGYNTQANGFYSHAEGQGSMGLNQAAHAEGENTQATGQDSHAEGFNTKTGGNDSQNTLSAGTYSNSGAYAHSEGNATLAKAIASHAEGEKTFTTGRASHAEGYFTKTTNLGEHAEGKYNQSNTGTIHSVGFGDSENTRKNAIEIRDNGDVYINGIGGYNEVLEPETLQDSLETLQDSLVFQKGTSINTAARKLETKDITNLNTTASFYINVGDYIYRLSKNFTEIDIHEGDKLTADDGLTYVTIIDLGFEYFSDMIHTNGLLSPNTSETISISKIEFIEQSVASGKCSSSLGVGTVAYNVNETAMGYYNKSNNTSPTDDYHTIFSIGNGSESNRENALEITKNGNVYINGIGGYDGTNPGVARRIQDALMQCTGVKNIISLTKAEYDALTNKDSETIYVVAEYSHDYVDLGLRDGNNNKILFATCNIGASVPQEYGDYFAWGETSKRYTSISGSSVIGGSFKLSNYPYHTGNNYDTGWSKYIPTGMESYSESGVADNKLTLEVGDDVASVLWGGNWRMPDKSDLEYLISSNVTYSWTNDYNGTGVAGFIVIGKDAFSSASLFLPAAGGCDDTDLYYAGDYGIYWSRSVYSDNPSGAWGIGGQSIGGQSMSVYDRYNGLSVRPVNVGDVVALYKLYKGSTPINDTYSKSEIDAKIGDIESILETI